MIVVIIEKDCTTSEGAFTAGEIVSAPDSIAEWLIHNELAMVARNWRQGGERTAPKPIPTRFL